VNGKNITNNKNLNAAEEVPGRYYLFAISFISLFLELLLIRWIGSEIRIFAYFRNLVLISCFLGLGIGFNIKRFRPGLVWSLVLMSILVALAHPRAELAGVSLRKIPEYLVFSEFHYWYSSGESTLLKMGVGFLMTAVVVVLLAGIFVPYGRVLGDIFERSDNRIRDYSINLLGSLTGTWAFAVFSYLTTPPWIWIMAGAGGTVALIRPRTRSTIIGAVLLIPMIILTNTDIYSESGLGTYWSPYQKLQLSKRSSQVGPHQVPFLSITVNSVLYMYIFDLSPEQAERYPGVFKRDEAPYYPYDMPFRLHPKPDKVLIVGAGAGNDAAAALRNGAINIDAVEIDPTIAMMGRNFHPEKPYQDQRVNLTVDDARSYFKKTKNKYDLIIFALLDSHTLTSNFTNINLDSYVYTLNSLEEARAHLEPEGLVAICFYPERPWLAYKIYTLLSQVFDQEPLVLNNYAGYEFQGTGGMLFVAGDLWGLSDRTKTDARLKQVIDEKFIPAKKFDREIENTEFDVPTDDWPYLYLQKRQIPTLHLIMIGIISLLMYLAIRLFFEGSGLGHSHFLFLGAGFLLVEVHSISKCALLFGSTWIVNVVIISAILIMILAANLAALKFKIDKTGLWYTGLFISLAASYFIPVSDLIVGNYLVRGVIAGFFYSLPLFFAGVIFASSIRKVMGVEAAFAANMMGAAIGGMLENASYLVGLKAMVLVAIALYAASAIALKRMPLRDTNEIKSALGEG
jgi:hypothetical protein